MKKSEKEKTLDPEKLYSVIDISNFLRVSPQFVRNLIKSGALHTQKIGKSHIIIGQDVLDWLKKTNYTIEPEDHERLTDEIPDKIAFSFFTGAGGLDIGMEQAGITPILVSDIDKHARRSISKNYPDAALIGDVTTYNADKIYKMAKIPRDQQVDFMFGGPPCQAFSTAGKRQGYNDIRGDVFIKYLDLIGEIKPKYAVIENVRGLLSIPAIFDARDTKGIKGGVLLYALKKLRSFGYTVSFDLYNSVNFGAPENRERVIIIAKLGNEKVDYLRPTHSDDSTYGLPEWITFGDVVKDLNEDEQEYVMYPAKRAKYLKYIPEGGNWRNIPPKLQKEAMGKAYELSGGKTGFFRRLSYSKPAPTLVTHPTMPATDLIHPKENRPLSVQEYARVQGFPDNWHIEGKTLDRYKQIGNAVPVPMARAIGERLIEDAYGKRFDKIEGFKYSRYKKTRDVEWENKVLQEMKKSPIYCNTEISLDLF